MAAELRLVVHGHIHSERPLQKLLCGLPDWSAFTLCLAQRGTRNVLGDIARQPSAVLKATTRSGCEY